MNCLLLKALTPGRLEWASIFNVVITEKDEVKNYRDLQQSDFALRKEIDYHLLAEGIYTKPLNRYSLSTVHGEKG